MGNYISVVPGNHDKFSDDYGTPNGKNFELRFGDYMPNFAAGVGHWIDEKEGQQLGFVFADFALQSRTDAADKVIGAFGQGRRIGKQDASHQKEIFKYFARLDNSFCSF